mmetsp:Transcript_16585/g.23635  ORF Transcript_16585/g.23635 Transcript_16585/m.23635 type:complete len:151 (+) Transcript_16585:7946-8398(+)
MSDSDLHLINLIIQRLEEERYTRQTKIRVITQHIRRLQEVRRHIVYPVRQRDPRTSTYNLYRTQLGDDITEAEALYNAFAQDQANNQEQRNEEQADTNEEAANASDEDVLPELEAAGLTFERAEQEFIQERGYLDDNHRRTVLRSSRPRR